MKRRLTFSPDAVVDLERLVDWLCEHSPARAHAVVDEIESRCRTLAEFPQLGRLKAWLRPGVREFWFGRATIVYEVLDDQVRVLGVAYGGQDVTVIYRRLGL